MLVAADKNVPLQPKGWGGGTRLSRLAEHDDEAYLTPVLLFFRAKPSHNIRIWSSFRAMNEGLDYGTPERKRKHENIKGNNKRQQQAQQANPEIAIETFKSN